MSAQPESERLRLRVYGIVQGVGFRPFVYALASELELSGFVGNDSRGVFIEAQGAPCDLARFARRLEASPPPLAVIDRVEARPIPRLSPSTGGFEIVASVTETARSTPVSPDVSVCDDCLRELLDPGDRRFHYPFINCTNCGPRFTIVRNLPYDRPETTMARFTMCAACNAEYHDPLNRRFHAQPNACADCGPSLWFSDDGSDTLPGSASNARAIARCRAALADGAIIAIKGIGGFHLACDARSDEACRRLRERKGRVDKPFAVMVRELELAERFVEVSPEARSLLRSKERPIVILPKRGTRVARGLSPLAAPGSATLGMMLPYSPLHYLLLDEEPLVMTSGNRSEEPIVKDNEEARRRLAELADGFLFHDREIEIVCDDSVVRVVEGHELPIRRSRGYAPFPLKSPLEGPSVLGIGGELKATFCLTKDGIAYLSQHMGDMENLETLRAFEHGLAHLCRLFAVEPCAVACDRHPGYLSTAWAKRYAAREALPLIEVQHHHAHIAALMAECELPPDARVVGLACDGTGYGTDGAVWGFEVLEAGYDDFERLAHAAYVPLPGGDAAIRKPYRMALAYLHDAGIPWDERLPPVAWATATERAVLARQLARRLRCTPTSSLGRLFDAVAALAGVRQEASYEAQAALELEAVTSLERDLEPYAFGLERGSGSSSPWIIDPRPVLEGVVRDRIDGARPERIAGRFHLAAAELIERAAVAAKEVSGLEVVALSGGVFQNVCLLSLATERLRRSGFRVLSHRAVPPNDAGLALGQAAVATARLAQTATAS